MPKDTDKNHSHTLYDCIEIEFFCTYDRDICTCEMIVRYVVNDRLHREPPVIS